MLETSFWFDGIQGKEMGIELQEPFTLSSPVPNITTVTVPGRNGELHYFDGSYKNRTADAPCFILDRALQYDIDKVNAWLMGSHGYRKLVFDSDPEHYLMARAKSGISNKPIVELLNGFDLSFDCKPQRYLVSGEIPYDIIGKGSITNPTDNAAYPLIELRGNTEEGNQTTYLTLSDGTNGFSLTVGAFDGTAIFDTEVEAGYGANFTVSGDIRIPPRATMKTDSSTSIPDGITYIRIIPRWWQL